MKQYTIQLAVDEKWLEKWYQNPEEDMEPLIQRMQLWLEIQCAGTGVSIESIEETV